jgi:hypothetical protein
MAVRFVDPRWRSIGHKQGLAPFDNPPKRP